MGFIMTLIIGVVLTPLWATGANSALNAHRSGSEEDEVGARLRSFYAEPANPAVMNQGIPKYGVDDGRRVSPNPFLRFQGDKPAAGPAHPLLRLAQKKGTKSFRKAQCETFSQVQRPDGGL